MSNDFVFFVQTATRCGKRHYIRNQTDNYRNQASQQRAMCMLQSEGSDVRLVALRVDSGVLSENSGPMTTLCCDWVSLFVACR